MELRDLANYTLHEFSGGLHAYLHRRGWHEGQQCRDGIKTIEAQRAPRVAWIGAVGGEPNEPAEPPMASRFLRLAQLLGDCRNEGLDRRRLDRGRRPHDCPLESRPRHRKQLALGRRARRQ